MPTAKALWKELSWDWKNVDSIFEFFDFIRFSWDLLGRISEILFSVYHLFHQSLKVQSAL